MCSDLSPLNLPAPGNESDKAAGSPKSLEGVTQSEQATRILESITDAFIALDRDWRLVFVNREAERLLMRRREELLGRNLWEEFPEAVGSDVYPLYHRVMSEKVSGSLEYYFPPLQMWFDVRVYPADDGGLSIFFRDITRRHMVEERLRLILESVTDYAILTTGLDRRVTNWNPGAAKLFGYLEAEILGQPIDIVFTPEDRTNGAPEGEIRTAMETGTSENTRWCVRKDGSRFLAGGVVRPMCGPDGAPIGVVKVCHDVTAEWRAKETLRANEENFRALANNIAQLAWMADAEGNIFWYNQRWFDYTGTTLEESANWGWQKVHHPDHVGRVVEKIARSFEKGEPWEDTFPLRGKDGQYHWFLSRAIPIRDESGRVLRWFGTNTDITEQREAEQALRESRRQLELALRGADLGAWQVDLQTGQMLVNCRWAEMLGYSLDELAPRMSTWERLVHPDDLPRARQALEEHFAGHTDLYQAEVRMRTRDGGWCWVLARGQLMERDSAGRPTIVAGTHLDITDRKKAETALQEADRRKDEFLAALAHELRNPLAAVKNAASVLEMSDEVHDRRWARKVVERQVGQITHLVEDLMDISRISSGKIHLRKEFTDAARVLDHSVETVRPLMKKKHHNLTVSYPHGGALPVNVDAARLEQIVVNLLTNAAKYTEDHGRVWLEARRENDWVIVSVRDNGMGIRPDLLPEMFELFAQGERTMKSSEGGLGLGLNIVKKLTEMHGGVITAYSEGPGKGSEFTIRLPAVESIAQDIETTEARSPAKTGRARILVVDDNVDTARGMCRLLKLLGHTVEIAYDGPSSLKIARHFRPDFVLLDIGLPEMDGYQVASRLRLEACCHETTIIAISGFGQEDDKRRAYEAGFDHHLVKPVDYDELKALLKHESERRE